MRDALIKSWHHGKIVKIVCLPLLWQFSLNKCNLTFSLPNNNIYFYQLVKTMQEIKLMLCIIKFEPFDPALQNILCFSFGPLGKIIVRQSQTKLLCIPYQQLCAQLNKPTSSFDCRFVKEHEAWVKLCFFIKPFL